MSEVELFIGEIGHTEQTTTWGVFDGEKDFEVTVPKYYSPNEVLSEIMRVKDMLDRGVGILGR